MPHELEAPGHPEPAERGPRLGAWLTDLSLDEVRQINGQRPNYSAIRADWDEPFRRREKKQNVLLGSLPSDDRYAHAFIECC